MLDLFLGDRDAWRAAIDNAFSDTHQVSRIQTDEHLDERGRAITLLEALYASFDEVQMSVVNVRTRLAQLQAIARSLSASASDSHGVR